MHDAWLARLFVRFRDRRDGRALAAVFDATARELIGVAAHLVPTLDQAEDAVQTTFQRAIEHADRFDGSRSLKGWLYGILWREAARIARTERRAVDPDALVPRSSREPADELVAEELPAAVRAAVARLPAPYREVLGPVLCEERSAREVAECLGRSPGTVRVQLQRGLERLRRELPAARRATTDSRALGVLGAGLGSLRERVLRHAGFAPAAIPAASGAFLTWQLATAAPTPAFLLAAAVLTAGTGAGIAQLRSISRVAPVPAPVEPQVSELLEPPVRAEVELAPASRPEMALPAAATVAAREPATGKRQDPAPVERPQVTGTVVNEGGLHLPGLEVVAEGENHYGYEATTSDARGRFAFSSLAAGRWFFHVDDERFARMDWKSHAVDVEEDDGEVFEADLRIVLEGSHALRGALRCAGEPVAATQVACRRIRSGVPFRANAELEAGGRYRLERLPAGSYELLVAMEGALTRSFEVRVDEPETWFDLELPAGRIEGRLVGVEFEPDRTDFDRRHVLVFPHGWYQESGNRGVFVEPDAGGGFVVRHLAPGDYAVWVARAKQPAESRVVTITAADPVQEVELGPARELGTVSGRITGLAGRASVAFLAREPQGLRRVGYAAVEGGAFRQVLEPGPHALLVSDFDARSPFTWVHEVEVAAGVTRALELALPESRPVRVRLEAGEAWTPRTAWRLRMPTGEWLSYLLFVGSDAEGRRAPTRPFRLPLGTWALEADFGDPAPLVQEFTVVPGDGIQEIVVQRP